MAGPPVMIEKIAATLDEIVEEPETEPPLGFEPVAGDRNRLDLEVDDIQTGIKSLVPGAESNRLRSSWYIGPNRLGLDGVPATLPAPISALNRNRTTADVLR